MIARAGNSQSVSPPLTVPNGVHYLLKGVVEQLDKIDDETVVGYVHTIVSDLAKHSTDSCAEVLNAAHSLFLHPTPSFNLFLFSEFRHMASIYCKHMHLKKDGIFVTSLCFWACLRFLDVG